MKNVTTRNSCTISFRRVFSGIQCVFVGWLAGWFYLFIWNWCCVVLRARLDILFINCLYSTAYIYVHVLVSVYLCMQCTENWKWGLNHFFIHPFIHTHRTQCNFCFVLFCLHFSITLIRIYTDCIVDIFLNVYTFIFS